MFGFAAASAAGKLCRGYAAVLGGLPQPCLTRGGTPMLAVTAIVLLAVVVVAMMARSALQRR